MKKLTLIFTDMYDNEIIFKISNREKLIELKNYLQCKKMKIGINLGGTE